MADLPPECRMHGPMVRRDMTGATYEQTWVGIWWDCTKYWCTNSHLDPSSGLRAQYDAHNTRTR